MRLTYAVFILLLALVTSAQSQQTATDWFNKGVDLYGQSKYDDAVKAYDEAIKINPKDDEAWSNKGVSLKEQGKYNESIEA